MCRPDPFQQRRPRRDYSHVALLAPIVTSPSFPDYYIVTSPSFPDYYIVTSPPLKHRDVTIVTSPSLPP